ASNVTRWIPILEPEHLVNMAWIEGQWPPGGGPFWSAYTALLSLMKCHAAAYRAIHHIQPDAQVGLSVRARRCRPANSASEWDLRAANRESRRSLELLVEAACGGRARFPFKSAREMADTADFLAVSYYGAETVRWAPDRPLRFFRALTDEAERPARAGVYLPDAEGFKEVLSRARVFGRPILIAGNGVDTEDDKERCRFLLDHLAALDGAIREGADVRGYFHRSLLDGFEWTDGYSSRYGLVHVDWETLGRTPNPSAYLFKDICETGAIRTGAVERFAPGWSWTGETV
ncbi:MAG: family 1 glycosylhydrolase, partial [Candidatus Hydrogenedentes bacterium]|nr:family 1 glycosylhydrolase [Candidatus Hydrogenedentota bacterium]